MHTSKTLGSRNAFNTRSDLAVSWNCSAILFSSSFASSPSITPSRKHFPNRAQLSNSSCWIVDSSSCAASRHSFTPSSRACRYSSVSPRSRVTLPSCRMNCSCDRLSLAPYDSDSGVYTLMLAGGTYVSTEPNMYTTNDLMLQRRIHS